MIINGRLSSGKAGFATTRVDNRRNFYTIKRPKKKRNLLVSIFVTVATFTATITLAQFIEDGGLRTIAYTLIFLLVITSIYKFIIKK